MNDLKCPFQYNEVETVHILPAKIQSVDVEMIDGTPDRLHLTGNDYTCTRQRYLYDCIREECAMWQDGKCQRRA